MNRLFRQKIRGCWCEVFLSTVKAGVQLVELLLKKGEIMLYYLRFQFNKQMSVAMIFLRIGY